MMPRTYVDDLQLVDRVLFFPGSTTLEIARAFDLCETTVRKHLRKLEKTGKVVHRMRGKLWGRGKMAYGWYVWPGPEK